MASIVIGSHDREIAPAIRDVARVFRGEGHTVDVFHTGLDVVARMQEAPVDVIVADAFLPGRHGFEIVTENASRTVEDRAAVALLSMRSKRPGDLVRGSAAKLARIDAIIVKPPPEGETATFGETLIAQIALLLARRGVDPFVQG